MNSIIEYMVGLPLKQIDWTSPNSGLSEWEFIALMRPFQFIQMNYKRSLFIKMIKGACLALNIDRLNWFPSQFIDGHIYENFTYVEYDIIRMTAPQLIDPSVFSIYQGNAIYCYLNKRQTTVKMEADHVNIELCYINESDPNYMTIYYKIIENGDIELLLAFQRRISIPTHYREWLN